MNRTLIIAEAGVNHNGDLQLAKDLVKVAAEAGADVVKFQTFIPENLVTSSAPKAKYQIENTKNNNDSQLEMLQQLQLKFEWHDELKTLATELGISFCSTGFDLESIDFLCDLGIPFLKIPSGELTNKPYLIHIAQKKLPIILSTGMADMKEVEQALNILLQYGANKSEITVLHCTTNYPTPFEEVNLKAMLTMEQQLGVNVGYSDHTNGSEVAIAAVALGAKVIEKHFTLDRNLPGPDHAASLEPNELKYLISAIRNTESALSGTGIKAPTSSELDNRLIARKSLVLNKNLEKGAVISSEDVSILRPGTGISPMEIDKVLGRKLALDLLAFTVLQPEHLQ